jgi:hypothetical protein
MPRCSKLTGPGEPPADFKIVSAADHLLKRIVHLFVIESPGLTASLSLAEDVVARLRSEAQRNAGPPGAAQHSSLGESRGLAQSRSAGSRSMVVWIGPVTGVLRSSFCDQSAARAPQWRVRCRSHGAVDYLSNGHASRSTGRSAVPSDS